MNTKQETLKQGFELIKSNLKSLELMIKEEFNVDMKLSANLEESRNGCIVRITSQDLLDQLGNTLVHRLFSSIKFYTWGGSAIIMNENLEEEICFSPKLSYEHPTGGSNGTDFCNGLWFNIDKKDWIIRK